MLRLLPVRRAALPLVALPLRVNSLSVAPSTARLLATISDDNNTGDARKTNNSVAEQIINDCFKSRSSVQELNDKCNGPLEKNGLKNTVLPFVFLLGNHSSGKSSFINYVCGR